MQFEQQIGPTNVSGGIASARVKPVNDHGGRHLTQDVQRMEVAVTQTLAVGHADVCVKQRLLAWFIEKRGRRNVGRERGFEPAN